MILDVVARSAYLFNLNLISYKGMFGILKLQLVGVKILSYDYG